MDKAQLKALEESVARTNPPPKPDYSKVEAMTPDGKWKHPRPEGGGMFEHDPEKGTLHEIDVLPNGKNGGETKRVANSIYDEHGKLKDRSAIALMGAPSDASRPPPATPKPFAREPVPIIQDAAATPPANANPK